MKPTEILSAVLSASLAALCLAGAILLGQIAVTVYESREAARPKPAPIQPVCPCCPFPQDEDVEEASL